MYERMGRNGGSAVKKKIKVPIKTEQLNGCFYPIDAQTKLSIKTKIGSETKTVGASLGPEEGLDKEKLENFFEKFSKLEVDLEPKLTYNLHTVVEMDICQTCGIGTGKTHYPEGWFEHEERSLKRLHKYDLCGTCYKRYEGFNPEELKRLVDKTTKDYKEVYEQKKRSKHI